MELILQTQTIIDLAKAAGSLGFTISEIAKAADHPESVIEPIVEALRHPLKDEKLPHVIRTFDKRDDSTVYCHVSQMANYTFDRKARMTEENPDYGKFSTPLQDIVNDVVYERAMAEDTDHAE